MIEFQHELRTPQNDEEWRAFHAIRRKVLFENGGKAEAYIPNHRMTPNRAIIRSF